MTVPATIILLAHIPAVSRMAGFAAEPAFAGSGPDVLPTQLIIHAAGGLVVLLAATMLSVFKPWGRTRYGRG